VFVLIAVFMSTLNTLRIAVYAIGCFFVDRKELITGKMCTIVNDVCILKNVSSQNGNCSKLKLILLLTFYIAFVFFDCYAIYCLFYLHLSSAVKKLSAP